MKKIQTIFERDWNTKKKLVIDKWVEGCEWVRDGEGYATQKFDGTPVLVAANDKIFKRVDMKGKALPDGAFLAQEWPDKETGYWPAWVPCDKANPQDKYFFEGYEKEKELHTVVLEGTYELIGPKINGNPENWPYHGLVEHGSVNFGIGPRTFDTIKKYLEEMPVEGLVFYTWDRTKLAKIKRRDYGIEWPCRPTNKETS